VLCGVVQCCAVFFSVVQCCAMPDTIHVKYPLFL
jgi:hypothetical protein